MCNTALAIAKSHSTEPPAASVSAESLRIVSCNVTLNIETLPTVIENAANLPMGNPFTS